MKSLDAKNRAISLDIAEVMRFVQMPKKAGITPPAFLQLSLLKSISRIREQPYLKLQQS